MSQIQVRLGKKYVNVCIYPIYVSVIRNSFCFSYLNGQRLSQLWKVNLAFILSINYREMQVSLI